MRCTYCGEEWELDSIHEEVSYKHGDEVNALREQYKDDPRRYKYDDPFQKEYESRFFNPVKNDFFDRGCVALGGSDCRKSHPKRNLVLDGLADVLGDDIDGMEAMIEDAEYLGIDLGF